MTPRNQCGHCGRGGSEPRPWQDRFDLLCWSCNGWLVERERAERAEADAREARAKATLSRAAENDLWAEIERLRRHVDNLEARAERAEAELFAVKAYAAEVSDDLARVRALMGREAQYGYDHEAQAVIDAARRLREDRNNGLDMHVAAVAVCRAVAALDGGAEL